jgi:hypothetical protein
LFVQWGPTGFLFLMILCYFMLLWCMGVYSP